MFEWNFGTEQTMMGLTYWEMVFFDNSKNGGYKTGTLLRIYFLIVSYR